MLRLVHVVAIVGLGLTASCGLVRSDKPLHDLRSNQREPEEFGIVPNRPLLDPQSYAQLPAPTPGAANRADQNPKADAVAALGGNAAALNPNTGVPASDAALLARATRYGRDANVRADLAAADAEFRKGKNIFTWSIIPDDRYNRAYSSQSLDPQAWLQRYRAAGARTPSAPPLED
jgi:hypothetical protein